MLKPSVESKKNIISIYVIVLLSGKKFLAEFLFFLVSLRSK